MAEFNKPTEPPTPMQRMFDDAYEQGWNTALEMAAHRIENDFITAFGKDTLQSIAIYIRGMKR